jgi:CRISPR-associated protein Csy1
MTNVRSDQAIGAVEIRALLHGFIKKRLDDKLEKLSSDDPSRSKLLDQYQPATWLADVAARSSRVKAVTHSLKPFHPNAKGTSVFALSTIQAVHPWIGTRSLGDTFRIDGVCNAAELPVYELLQLAVGGKTLLTLAVEKSPELQQALSDNLNTAREWSESFARLTEPSAKISSHTLAKQLYWPAGDNVHDDENFHLVSPLYPTALVQEVYETIQADRFGDEAKLARTAKREKVASSATVHDYPNLAMQKLGGTKPQNISQLNSERRGQNLLLPSLPPVWKSAAISPILGQDTMFRAFGRRADVRNRLNALIAFLKSNPRPNEITRTKVAGHVQFLVDAFFEFTGALRQLPTGWTSDVGCNLNLAEKIWLDAEAVREKLRTEGTEVPRDVPEQIAERFANWFNARLKHRELPVGSDEAHNWRREVLKQIDTELRTWREEETDALL